eukprot:gene9176-12266_t
MAPTGTDEETFELTGRIVYRKDGALRLADGTLAGADLTMIDAVAYANRTLGLALEETLRMAARYPAQAIGDGARGVFENGAQADLCGGRSSLASPCGLLDFLGLRCLLEKAVTGRIAMKFGVLGTGAVGQTVAGKLVAMGHDVMMGARAADNEKVLGFAQRTGGKAGTFAEAAAHGEMVFNCTRGDTSVA